MAERIERLAETLLALLFAVVQLIFWALPLVAVGAVVVGLLCR